jgi:hypothetical protein
MKGNNGRTYLSFALYIWGYLLLLGLRTNSNSLYMVARATLQNARILMSARMQPLGPIFGPKRSPHRQAVTLWQRVLLGLGVVIDIG